MNTGTTIFAQLMDFSTGSTFDRVRDTASEVGSNRKMARGIIPLRS